MIDEAQINFLFIYVCNLVNLKKKKITIIILFNSQ